MFPVLFPIVALVSATHGQELEWARIPLTLNATKENLITSVSWKSAKGENWSIEWDLLDNGRGKSLLVKGLGSSQTIPFSIDPYEINSPPGSPFLSKDSLLTFQAGDWEIFCLQLGTGAVGIPAAYFVCVLHHKPTNKIFYEYGSADGDDFIQLKSKTHPVLVFRTRDRPNNFFESNMVTYEFAKGRVIRSTTIKAIERSSSGLTPRSTRTPPALPSALSLLPASSAPLNASAQAGPVSFIR